jgi:peptide/nickel transport system ATP-binding protein
VVERCRHEAPPLESVGHDHSSACWRAEDVEPLTGTIDVRGGRAA